MSHTTIVQSDAISALREMPAGSVHCCVTSPPYFRQRDYGNGDGQIGLEKNQLDFAESLAGVFAEVSRVLRDDGTLWINLGDSYVSKQVGFVPQIVAMKLGGLGWRVRQDIIWHKPSSMPESVRDRFSRAHEHVLLLTKTEDYYLDAIDLPEFRKDVWTIPSKGFKGAHFAVMPEKLAEVCIEAGTSPAGCCGKCGTPYVREVRRTRVPTRPGRDTKATQPGIVQGNRDPLRHVTKVETLGWKPGCECGCELSERCVVLDPFAGAGTTLAVADRLDRDSIGIEINPIYCNLIRDRIGAREGES